MFSTWQMLFCAALTVLVASTSVDAFPKSRERREEPRDTEQDPALVGPKSCKEILDAQPSAVSGEYRIATVDGYKLKVYCEMSINGGGYTFIKRRDVDYLTDNDVQKIFTDKSSFLLTVQKSSGQAYGVIKQLPEYARYGLKLGLSDNAGYADPVNVDFLTGDYLYYGFLPISVAQQTTVQGIEVLDVEVTFENCDGTPNSYIALFTDFKSKPTTHEFDTKYKFCNQLFSSLKPSASVLSKEYFMFMEVNFGGCGCYTQTDGRPSIGGISGAAVGFK